VQRGEHAGAAGAENEDITGEFVDGQQVEPMVRFRSKRLAVRKL
jgi:hypothetical protein